MKQFIIPLLLVASCSTLKREDCQTMDWYNKGLEDARNDGQSEIDGYEKTCKEYGLSVLRSDYDSGFKKGLNDFCTFDKGYEYGKNGKSHFNECSSLNSEFSNGYAKSLKDIEENQKKQEEELKEKKEKDLKEAVERLNECSSDFDCERDGKRCETETQFIHSAGEMAEIRVCK